MYTDLVGDRSGNNRKAGFYICINIVLEAEWMSESVGEIVVYEDLVEQEHEYKRKA